MRRACKRVALTGAVLFACALGFSAPAEAGVQRMYALCGDYPGTCDAANNYKWDLQLSVAVEHSLTATGEHVWIGQSVSGYGHLVGEQPINNNSASRTQLQPQYTDPTGDLDNYIRGIAFDPVTNTLFVADSDDYRVLAFPRGNFPPDGVDYATPAQTPAPVTSGAASPGGGNGEFSSISGPRGMAFSTFNNRLYVADWFNARVQIFSYTPGASPSIDYQGQFVSDWDTDAYLPADVAVNPGDGHVFVADGREDLVQEFDPDGNFIRAIGNGDAGASADVVSVAVDGPDHLLYSVKAGYIDVYSLFTGRRLGTFPQTAFFGNPANNLVDVDVDPVGRDMYVVTGTNAGDADNPPVSGYTLDIVPTCALAPTLEVQTGQSVNIPLSCTDTDGAPVKEFHRDNPPARGSITPNSDRTALTYTAGAVPGDDFAEYRVLTANGYSQTYRQPVKVVDPTPVVRKSANLELTSGDVFIRLPGTDQWVKLTEDTLIPIGTVIDARGGKAHLTFANADGSTYEGTFWDGVFQVTQGSGANPIATMKLRDDLAGVQQASSLNPFQAAIARRRGKKKNGLWGDAHGKYRTSGKGGSATVRGTKWYVADYTYGALFKVARGKVLVDPKRGRNFILKAGMQKFVWYRG